MENVREKFSEMVPKGSMAFVYGQTFENVEKCSETVYKLIKTISKASKDDAGTISKLIEKDTEMFGN